MKLHACNNLKVQLDSYNNQFQLSLCVCEAPPIHYMEYVSELSDDQRLLYITVRQVWTYTMVFYTCYVALHV